MPQCGFLIADCSFLQGTLALTLAWEPPGLQCGGQYCPLRPAGRQPASAWVVRGAWSCSPSSVLAGLLLTLFPSSPDSTVLSPRCHHLWLKGSAVPWCGSVRGGCVQQQPCPASPQRPQLHPVQWMRETMRDYEPAAGTSVKHNLIVVALHSLPNI